MDNEQRLKKQIERQTKRMKQAEREKPTLLAQTSFLGVLGLVFVLPIVAGAYLGHWLDKQLAGYSVHWTISLVLLGILVGATNVYLLLREGK